jgi:hypothetical protein
VLECAVGVVNDHVRGHFFDDIELTFGEFGGVGRDVFYQSTRHWDVKDLPILASLLGRRFECGWDTLPFCRQCRGMLRLLNTGSFL